MTGEVRLGGEGPIKVVVDADLADLIPGYLDKRRQDIGKIEEALNRGDMEAVRIIGHSMAGSGGSYGFDEITRLGRTMEKAAKENEGVILRDALRDLQSYLSRVVVEFAPV